MAGLEPGSAGPTSTAVRASTSVTVPHLSGQQRCLVPGAADEGGRPRVTPVCHAADGGYGRRSFKPGVTTRRRAIREMAEAGSC
jgi:hypothetical protein